MTPIAGILRQLLPCSCNVLTFPSQPDFDVNWNQYDKGQVYFWCYRTLKYSQDKLPKTTLNFNSDSLPVDCQPNIVVAFDQLTYQLGRQLSQLLHIPLCLFVHDARFMVKAHYYCFINEGERVKSGQVGPVIQNINDIGELCRNIHGETYLPL